MTQERHAGRVRGAALHQLVGVAAQVAYGAPAIVSSLVLARFADLRLVADLALAFALTSTVFTAASFNLTQSLALWGARGFTVPTFWLNRLMSSVIGLLVAVAILALMRTDPRVVVLAVSLKFADALADLRFGLRLLKSDGLESMTALFAWSIARLVLFTGVTALALRVGLDGATALMVGGVATFVFVSPWRDVELDTPSPSAVTSAMRLGASAAHLAVAGTASGLLVTVPRLVTEKLVPEEYLGYYGMAFVATTLVGMSFNVAWLRLAAATRDSDPDRAMRTFLVEGTALGLLLIGGLWLSSPVVAWIYGVPLEPLRAVFFPVGSAIVFLYFSMALANMLKTSSLRFLEAGAYVASAATLATLSMSTGSLVVGVLGAAAVLMLIVFAGVGALRRVMRG